ncbi:hypothetical protein A4A49_55224 [Nicotiana attenuata]|uniref:Uncharacterized protein n=1 Tax=Nicotiana attenuata TaxID=49451 RepID=A0A314L4H1_NICAT|nr:hypothetical protein A4A49_55224 [Nicotiana attenuata]
MAKYYRKAHPLGVKWRQGQSKCWKALCEIRDEVEKNLVWIPREGIISFWHDNWTKQGPLINKVEGAIRPKEILLRDILENDSWRIDKIEMDVPDPIRNILALSLTLGVQDKAVRTANSSGIFSIGFGMEPTETKERAVKK